ncbi:polymorphic toxin type 44 domain-containing protein [Shewanella denitrificans]|nr:polymorphic toxin type 44 domain-containing protein [Shewanella denitrificans]
MHRTGGALDVAHSQESDYIGSASMGNFLYGANAKAMGFTESTILRGAAFYQAIGNDFWSNLPHGIYNYVTNTGDNPGDPEQTLAGVRYHDEVFMKNQSDPSSVSCADAGSAGNALLPGGGEGGNPGGGAGGGSGDIGGGSGRGTKWCFYQKGFPTYCWITP